MKIEIFHKGKLIHTFEAEGKIRLNELQFALRVESKGNDREYADEEDNKIIIQPCKLLTPIGYNPVFKKATNKPFERPKAQYSNIRLYDQL